MTLAVRARAAGSGVQAAKPGTISQPRSATPPPAWTTSTS